jgi:nitrogen fixation/metabolism regulation signal transduction histidine kinase
VGILVTGAEKVERKVGRLKLNLQTVTDEARVKADARIRPAWEAVKKRLGREAKMPLRETKLQARRLLKRIIDSAIQKLEKLNRGLEQDRETHGYAA